MTTRTLRTLFLVASTQGAIARAQAPDPAALADTLRVQIEQKVLAGDEAGLAAVVKRAQRAATVYPKEMLLHHYAGYGVYRLIQMPNSTLSEATKASMIAEALASLDAANKITPMAESYVERWSLMAQTITDAGSAMAVVNVMQEELAQAMRLGKDNPRVWLVNGIGTFFTPSMWGGGAQAALGHLVKAKLLFENDHPGKGMPAWGKAETSVWLGIAHQKLGHAAEAKTAYEEALRLEPKLTWVSQTLLPGLAAGKQPFPEIP